MAKKKRQYEGIDDEELELLNSKMYPQQSKPESYKSTIAPMKIKLKCKNQRQKELHKAITEKEIVFCQGSAGTGKSYVAAATALELLKSGAYSRIIICCPNVEASAMSVGLLPGNLDEKLQPFLDAIEFTIQKILNESGNLGSREILNSLLRSDVIMEEAVSFLRGKTFDNSVIIIDEAENLNKQETLLILSRIGRNSKMVFLGDSRQTDRKDIKKSKEKCGLDHAIEVLQGMDEVGFVEFTDEDIVRNPVISKIIKRWSETNAAEKP